MEPFGADEHQKSSVDVARWRAARQGFLERTDSSHSTVAAGGPAARLRREAHLNAGSISSVTRLNWRFWSYPATLSRMISPSLRQAAKSGGTSGRVGEMPLMPPTCECAPADVAAAVARDDPPEQRIASCST